MDEVRDPVCGMMVDRAKAAATTEYDGETYYFCSQECREAFELSPERYAIQADEPRFTRALGIPAPKYGFATSGGAEYEPPSVNTTRRSTPKKRSGRKG